MTTTETPAAELRAAAKLIRERAEGIGPGPWTPSVVTVTAGAAHFADPAHDVAMVKSATAKIAICGTPYDAEHIASWHPVVALAVADWLETEAAIAERGLPDDGGIHPALRVARAYLGETP